MSIRKKAILFFSSFIIALVIIGGLALDLIITNNFGALEKENAEKDIMHHKEMLELNLIAMHPIVDDWSLWDDMYDYVQDPNPDFESSNLGESTLESLHLQAMYIWNKDGELVHKDISTDNILNLANTDFDEITRKVKPLLDLGDDHKFFSGYVADNNNVFFVGAHSILRSDTSGPYQGIFLVLRHVHTEDPKSDMFLSGINTPVNLYKIKDPTVQEDFKSILSELEKNMTVTITVGQNEIKSYTLAKDLFGEPVILFESTFTREIYQQGLQVKSFAEIAITIIALVIGFFAYYQFDNELIKGITTITAFMQIVAKNPQSKERLALHTNQEMSILSDTLNNMLDQFSEQQRTVEKSNLELARINKQIADKQQELAKGNQELSELNQAMIGREMKMVELKKEVELLRSRLGQQPLP